jgi:hypothetical protein
MLEQSTKLVYDASWFSKGSADFCVFTRIVEHTEIAAVYDLMT